MQILTDKDLAPNLQKYLPHIDEKFLFYKQHGIKHPSPLFNVAIRKIDDTLEAFLEVLSAYNETDFEKVDKENTGKLLKTYKDFLYACREYLDDCFSVVKIFIEPPQQEKKSRGQYRWLELNAKSQVTDLFGSISEYKKYIDNSVNELKHNNGIMAGVAFFDANDGSQNCLGYFIANVIDGAYSPVEKIHPKLQDMYTAFSFRRDLHYNLFNVYRVSEEILAFIKDKMGIEIESLPSKTTEAPDRIKKIFRGVMEISRFHFPDEYIKPVPSVVLTSEDRLKLEYPSQLAIRPNRLNRVVLTHSGDGHTREFKIPYM